MFHTCKHGSQRIIAMPSSAANKVEHMRTLWKLLLRAKIWRDTHGQDMIEYGLLAGFITVTVAATFPPAASHISVIFLVLPGF